MNEFPWVIVGVIIGLILIGILVVMAFKWKRERKSQGTNYRALFILGITFLPIGVIYEITFFVSGTKDFLVLGLSFIAMGSSYIAIGLANKGKCKRNQG